MKKQWTEQIQNMLKAHPMPPIEPGRMEETIFQSKQFLRMNQRARRTSFWEFFIVQFRFIGKKVWGMQILIVLSMVLFVHNFLISSPLDNLQLLARAFIAAPLLALAGIQVLARSFTHNMMEIELCTKYSLEKLMMVRLSILSMVDMLCLAVLAISFSIQLKWEIGLIVLYLFVPFNLTCLGCLWILNRIRSKDSVYYCLVYGGSLMFVQFVLSFQRIEIYEESATGIWVVMLMVSSAAVVMEIRKMLATYRRMDMATLPYS